MSTSYSYNPSSLATTANLVPWQFRVRPTLVVTVVSIVATLGLIGLLVAARRLIGALTADLSLDLMLLIALGTAASLSFTRIAWRRSFPLETSADLSLADRLLGWASSGALALLAVGCCYPANRTADWMIWLPILVADQFWRQDFFDAGEPWTPASQEEPVAPPALTLAYASQDDNIVQQLYRLRDPQGCEVIYGTVRADFVAGQRTAVVHVGFCPPLAYQPEIEAEALPGSFAKLKIVQALAHGTRLDARLPAPAQTDCRVWIDLAARPVTAACQARTA